MAEEWRDIPGYEGAYQVSDQGCVRSVERRVRLVVHDIETTRSVPPRVLKPGRCASGHVTVCLGEGNSKGVHTLVLRAFVGEPPAGHEALHLNHIPNDNRLSNLRWGTRSENMKMDYAAGTRKKHDKLRRKNYFSRVTQEQIDTLKACSCRQEAISFADAFGISEVYCNSIRLGHASIS